VSIERAQLYENIHDLFEGFLGSSIAAIDERDRVTSGHSKRVMGYAMAFVDAAAADPHNPFSVIATTPERKRQFQFAALLHDIGKIGVPERVLQKESRLAAGEFALVMSRLDYIAFAQKHEPASVSWQSAREVADALTRLGDAVGFFARDHGALADECARRFMGDSRCRTKSDVKRPVSEPAAPAG